MREVEEETGVRARLVRELPSTSYEVSGRPKIVRYWLMDVDHEGPFEPNDETDQLRWVALDDALRLLTYDRDRDVLAGADSEPAARLRLLTPAVAPRAAEEPVAAGASDEEVVPALAGEPVAAGAAAHPVAAAAALHAVVARAAAHGVPAGASVHGVVSAAAANAVASRAAKDSVEPLPPTIRSLRARASRSAARRVDRRPGPPNSRSLPEPPLTRSLPRPALPCRCRARSGSRRHRRR